MQPITSTTHISSIPTSATAEVKPSLTVAKVQPSTEKMESVELLSTYTILYALEDHQHAIKKIETVGCEKNPIPHKAFAKSETLRYIGNINQNWVALEHISTVLYPSSAQLLNFRSAPSNPLPITETIKNKGTHCVHKVKTQLLLPLAENPIPNGAFAIDQLVTYRSANISTQSFATAIPTGSVTLTPSSAATEFFIVVPDACARQQGITNKKTSKKTRQAPTNKRSHREIRLPFRWKYLNKEIQTFYLDDIEQCLDLDATYSMITERHQLTRGNILALIQLRRKLRPTAVEIKLSRRYSQRYNKIPKLVLALPALPKDRIPLGQYLAAKMGAHKLRLV